jgi:hypothetical protein
VTNSAIKRNEVYLDLVPILNLFAYRQRLRVPFLNFFQSASANPNTVAVVAVILLHNLYFLSFVGIVLPSF